MRAKGLILLAATAAFVLSVATAASAAEKLGKPLTSKPTITDPRPDDSRERALRARAEFEPDGAPVRGRSRAVNERGDRPDGDEAGAGALGEDRGEGGGKLE
jgi:hypothetical protein